MGAWLAAMSSFNWAAEGGDGVIGKLSSKFGTDTLLTCHRKWDRVILDVPLLSDREELDCPSYTHIFDDLKEQSTYLDCELVYLYNR